MQIFLQITDSFFSSVISTVDQDTRDHKQSCFSSLQPSFLHLIWMIREPVKKMENSTLGGGRSFSTFKI